MRQETIKMIECTCGKQWAIIDYTSSSSMLNAEEPSHSGNPAYPLQSQVFDKLSRSWAKVDSAECLSGFEMRDRDRREKYTLKLNDGSLAPERFLADLTMVPNWLEEYGDTEEDRLRIVAEIVMGKRQIELYIDDDMGWQPSKNSRKSLISSALQIKESDIQLNLYRFAPLPYRGK